MQLKQLMRLAELDRQIRKGNTGNATMLSQKLHISRRQLYNYLDELRNLGILIKYCRQKKTFYYDEACKLTINCKFEFLDNQYTINLLGGKNNLCNLITQTTDNFALSNYHKAELRIRL